MGPNVQGNIAVYRSSGGIDGLTSNTISAFNNDRVVWGDWATVPKSALTTAQTAYSNWIGPPYSAIDHNSNFYVNSVLSHAGANPHIPGVFAPAFGR
jgi:hypothetical protein